MNEPPRHTESGSLGARHPKAVAIPLQRIPSVLPASYFYVKLTNAFGAYTFRLELVRRDDFTTLAEAVVPTFTAHEPLAYGEIVFRLANIPVTPPGYYDLRLWGNRHFIDSTSLKAKEVESDQEAEP